MKKRIFSGFLPLLLVCVMAAQTARAAEPRALEGSVNLAFDGTTAVCSATCYGKQPSDKLEVTLTLYQGSTYIDSWSGSGKWRVALSGECEVKPGKTYRLELTYSINGEEMPATSTTNTCP